MVMMIWIGKYRGGAGESVKEKMTDVIVLDLWKYYLPCSFREYELAKRGEQRRLLKAQRRENVSVGTTRAVCSSFFVRKQDFMS